MAVRSPAQIWDKPSKILASSMKMEMSWAFEKGLRLNKEGRMIKMLRPLVQQSFLAHKEVERIRTFSDT